MTTEARPAARLTRFRRDETASVSIETVMWVPFLVSVWVFLFSAGAAYNALIGNTNSAHAISDVVAWQTRVLTAEDLDGLNDLHGVISQAEAGTDVRVSTLRYDAEAESFALLGSITADTEPALTQQQVDSLTPKLPAVPDGDQLIVVETWLDHAPLSGILAASYRFHQVSTVRPRLAAQIRLVD
jgi:Flp pilus assembly protein TadG